MFFPRKTKIFEDIIKQSSIMLEVVGVFQKIVNDWSQLEHGCALLEKLEKSADDLVHKITSDIEKTFVLPLDKEDVKQLTELLDDIVDNLEQIVNRLKIYRISGSNQALKDFSTLIAQAAQKIHEGIFMVKERKLASEGFASCIKDLHELENEGDRLHRKILEDMIGRCSPEYGGKDALSTN